MEALGPGERAQMAQAMQTGMYSSLEEAMMQADPEELRERFGDEVRALGTAG